VQAEADHTAALFAAALAPSRGQLSRTQVSLLEEAPSFLRTCREAGKGVRWIVRTDVVRTPRHLGNVRLEIDWSLVRVAADGTRASFSPASRGAGPRPPGETNYASDALESDDEPRFDLVDFDGDGDPEMVVLTAGELHEDGRWQQVRIYAHAGGAIVPYAPARGIEASAIRDVDGDGRFDLVYHAPYETIAPICTTGFGVLAWGPELVAHALPDGTFSRDDAAALAFAKKSCPRPPRELVPEPNGWWRALDAIACARMWGESEASVTARLSAECGPPPKVPGADCDSKCGDRALYFQWAAIPPPLRLR